MYIFRYKAKFMKEFKRFFKDINVYGYNIQNHINSPIIFFSLKKYVTSLFNCQKI